MNKKTITISVLFIFLTATILPGTVNAAKSLTQLSADPETIDELLSPGDEEEIEITIFYKIDMNKLLFTILKFFRLGRVILYGGIKYWFKLLTNKQIPGAVINLEVESPDWCNATLSKPDVMVEISPDGNTETATLKISEISPDAPALEPGNIIITGWSDKVGTINPSQSIINMSIMAAYQPDLILTTEEEFNISPINETTIPIEVQNDGNGESKISIEFEDVPENWNATLDKEEITIGVDDSGIVLLSVIPVKTFVNDTVKLKFTPMSTTEEDVDEEDTIGEPVYIEVEFKNDGSLKEEDEGLPLLEIAVIIIIIVILLIIIYFFFFWRRE
jgi:hypothetical protein